MRGKETYGCGGLPVHFAAGLFAARAPQVRDIDRQGAAPQRLRTGVRGISSARVATCGSIVLTASALPKSAWLLRPTCILMRTTERTIVLASMTLMANVVIQRSGADRQSAPKQAACARVRAHNQGGRNGSRRCRLQGLISCCAHGRSRKGGTNTRPAKAMSSPLVAPTAA